MPSGSDSEARDPEWVALLIRGAKSIADGPIEELADAHASFLMVVENHGTGRDVELWRGVARLATYALLDESTRGYRIARRVLVVLRGNSPPPGLLSLEPQLERFVRAFERRKRNG
ncbi:MAG: hypothetical protein KDC87_03405 [Planctomycetes bacterium]|nr:hypothetical protein [Planctomycetota bacterium]MCB9871291.1 hypothetical protein [Planctomycetota bacterium]